MRVPKRNGVYLDRQQWTTMKQNSWVDVKVADEEDDDEEEKDDEGEEDDEGIGVGVGMAGV